MPQQNQNINLEVDSIAYINEFIGSSPGWLLKSGISMITLVVGVILVMSYFFKYPDKLTVKGELSSLNPPIEVKTRAPGIVDEIYMTDGDKVSKGQELLYIKNNASLPDIKKLELFISRYQRINTINALLGLGIPLELNLGELQSDYSNLVLKIKEVQNLASQTTTYEQIRNIDKEIENIKALSNSVAEEKEIFGEELALIQKDMNRSASLNKEGVISDQENELAASKLLQYDQKQARMSSSIIQNDIKVDQLNFQKLKLSSERDKAIQQYKFQISDIISRLESNLVKWKDGYIVTAPSDGTLNFDSEIVVNKTLDAQEEIAYILSDNIEQKKYIKAFSPVDGIGKVGLADRVLIKMDGYPHKEFGILESKLDYISPIPTMKVEGRSFYELRIALPDTLVTSYGKVIPFTPKATASLEIITEDKSVAERIFNQILDILKND